MASFNHELAERLREVRREMFGDYGAPLMADALHLPTQTWLNHESGVTVTDTVILAFLEFTGTEAYWLRTGLGNRYRFVPDRLKFGG